MKASKRIVRSFADRVTDLADGEATEQQVEVIVNTHARLAASSIVDELVIDSIVDSPAQSRRFYPPDEIEALADSIASEGLLQPVRVRRVSRDGEAVRYQLVYGHKRVAAHRLLAKRAELAGDAPPRVRAEIVELRDGEARLQTIVENEMRGGLVPYERALEVLSALEAHRELELPETLEAIREYFNGRSDEPLSRLRAIGQQFADPEAFRVAGITGTDGDVDWAAVCRLSVDDLHDAALASGEERTRLLREAVARRTAQHERRERRAASDGRAALVTKAARPTRRGRRAARAVPTVAGLLSRGRFTKRLRGPVRELTTDEAREHLDDLAPAVAALSEVAWPGVAVRVIPVPGSGVLLHIPTIVEQLDVAVVRAISHQLRDGSVE